MQSPWIRVTMWGTSQLGDFLNGWRCLGSPPVTRCRVGPINIFLNLFILLLAVQALSSVESRIYSLVAVHRLLITVASLVADTGFRADGFSNCETWA